MQHQSCVSSGSNLSLSSSSGVSSSKSLELRDEINQIEQQRQPPEESNPLKAGDFRFCDCDECKSEPIYTNRSAHRGNYHSNLKLRSLSQEPRAPTPPKGSATSVQSIKKAVSFRSSVEHIGSPNSRPLNDLKSMASNLMELMAKRPEDELESCDSLHATKDSSSLSLLQLGTNTTTTNGQRHVLANKRAACHAFASRPFAIKTMNEAATTKPKQRVVNEQKEEVNLEEQDDDDDYLRPLDCSTPKGSLQQQQQHWPPHHQVGGASWLPLAQSFKPSRQLFSPMDGKVNGERRSVEQQGEEIGGQNSDQLIQVEIHRPAATAAPINFASNPNYTCLCSPDFMCIHNGYPEGQTSAETGANNINTRVAENEAEVNPIATSSQTGRMIATRPTPAPLSNELLYGNITATANNSPPDFPLSNDCIECKNLSTYVNLSRTPAKSSSSAPEQQQQQQEQVSALQMSVNGYDSGDYKTLIRRQSQLYGNIGGYGSIGQSKAQLNEPIVISGAAGPAAVSKQQANLILEEPSHYLAEARRLQETIKDCEMCNEHLVQNGADSLYNNCNCQQQLQHQASNSTIRSQEQQQQQHQQLAQNYLSPSTSNSYHTALSASLQPNGQSQLDSSSSVAMINASKLSVLPVEASSRNQSATNCNQLHQRRTQSSLAQMDHFNGMAMSQHHNQQQVATQQHHQQQQIINNNQNVDSSLSSLFVYRHLSDDNSNGRCNTQAFDCDFDPDSLEIHPADELQPTGCSTVKSSLKSQNGKQRVTRSNQTIGAKGNNATTSAKTKANSCTSWLKGRSKNEYISLSSTTSTETKASGATNSSKKSSKSNNTDQQQQASTSFSVQPDVTQSSLAKRRQLSNSLQQKQQQQQYTSQSSSGNQGIAKRKLMLSGRGNSRSSPNLAAVASSSSSSGNLQKNTSNKTHHSRSSSSSAKSIYQCVKNHLRDITKSSSSSNQQITSSKSSASGSNIKGSSISLPRGFNSNVMTTAAAAPTTSAKSRATGKAAQVCIQTEF